MVHGESLDPEIQLIRIFHPQSAMQVLLKAAARIS